SLRRQRPPRRPHRQNQSRRNLQRASPSFPKHARRPEKYQRRKRPGLRPPTQRQRLGPRRFRQRRRGRCPHRGKRRPTRPAPQQRRPPKSLARINSHWKIIQPRRHRRPHHLSSRRSKANPFQSRRRQLSLLPRPAHRPRPRQTRKTRLARNQMAPTQRPSPTLHRRPHQPLHHYHRRRPSLALSTAVDVSPISTLITQNQRMIGTIARLRSQESKVTLSI